MTREQANVRSARVVPDCSYRPAERAPGHSLPACRFAAGHALLNGYKEQSSKPQRPGQTRAIAQAQQARQAERMARYEHLLELQKQGMKSAEIAPQLGVTPQTVQRWIATGGIPYSRPRRQRARLNYSKKGLERKNKKTQAQPEEHLKISRVRKKNADFQSTTIDIRKFV